MAFIIVKYSSYILTTVTKIRKIGLTGILISIFASSCSKDLPACKGNCDLITFSGNVSEFTSGQPVSGQAIKVILKQNICMICSTFNVAAGSSDANGHFEFTKKMDTSLLRDYHIDVQITTSDSYITRIASADSSVGYLYPRTNDLYFENIDSSLNRLIFKIYSKTSLHINLHRNSAIIPGREYFTLLYYLPGDVHIGEAFIMSTSNKDTAVLLNTGANVYTIINSSKFITYDSLVSKNDSIKCGINDRNSIDISY
jgi:hypothetical protein